MKILWWIFLSLLSISSRAGAVRLLKGIKPLHYRMTLLPVLGDQSQLYGVVWIHFQAETNGKEMQLNAQKMDIRIAVVGPMPSTRSQTRQSAHDRAVLENVWLLNDYNWVVNEANDLTEVVDIITVHPGVVTLILNDNLTAGAIYRLGIVYKANVADKANGAFQAAYNDEKSCCKSWIGVTQFEPTGARLAFPCVDEPQYKATFDITIGHRSSMTALSNMPVNTTYGMNQMKLWTWSRFEPTPPMSTYLVAWIITDFAVTEISVKTRAGTKVPIRLWTKPSDAYRATASLDMSRRVFTALDQYFRVPYSLPKMDIVALPFETGDFAGMENWGLITVKEEYVFLNAESTALALTKYISVHIHEWIHQWLGNLVTFRWWNDLGMVCEGPTSFLESVIAKQIGVFNDDIEAQTIIGTQDLMSIDLPGFTRPVTCDLLEGADTLSIFDPISYIKASAFFRMIYTFMDKESFRVGISNYLEKYQYDSVNASQLLHQLGQQAAKILPVDPKTGRTVSLETVMGTWANQVSYPLVHCIRSANKTRIVFTQTPFGNYSKNGGPKNCGATTGQPRWWIPLSMTNSQSVKCNLNRTSIVWLPPSEEALHVINPVAADEWILANFEAGGYFRVNYDEENWALLADQLMRNHTAIPLLSRAQILDDAFVLAIDGVLDWKVPKQLVRYLGMETAPVIRERVMKTIDSLLHIKEWNSVEYNYLSGLRQYLALPSMQSRNHFTSMYDLLNFQECYTDGPACIQVALRLFNVTLEGKLENNERRVVEDELETVWCTAIRLGGQDEWDYAWSHSIRSADWTNRQAVLASLACSRRTQNLKKLLTRIFHPDDGLVPAEAGSVLRRMAGNPIGRRLLGHFLFANWDRLKKHLGRSNALHILRDVTLHWNTAVQLSQVEDLLKNDNAIVDEDGTVSPGYILGTIRRNSELVEKLEHNEL